MAADGKIMTDLNRHDQSQFEKKRLPRHAVTTIDLACFIVGCFGSRRRSEDAYYSLGGADVFTDE